MDPFNAIVLAVIVLPIAILNLILFFKVWGMTNNTKHILNYLLNGTGPLKGIKQKSRWDGKYIYEQKE